MIVLSETNRFTFKPRPVPTIVTLVLLGLLTYLGFWQLQRAEQKVRLIDRFETHTALSAEPLAALASDLPAARYRQVEATGRYDTEHQILLDNQIYRGRPGVHVYTPLLDAASRQAILVNRGWIPIGPSRRQLPAVDLATARVSVSGRIGQPANPGLLLASEPAPSSWPQLVQHIDYQRLSAELGYPLLDAVILLDPAEANGYVRDWQPRFERLGPDRHRAYALQWFGLAVTLLVIFIATNLHRKQDG